VISRMRDQLILDIALHRLWGQCQKVKHIRIFQALLHQLRLGRWQRLGKVTHRLARTLMEALPNLPFQNHATPAVLGAGLGVQQYRLHRLDFGQQGAHMPPRHLSHGLWDNFKLRAKEGIELPHGKQAGARKAFHAGVAGLQVQRHLLHHHRSPSAFTLPGVQLAANVPVQAQQVRIHRQHGTGLCCLNALFDGSNGLPIVGVLSDFGHVVRLPAAARRHGGF
jgi:hypothetical protein